MKDKIIELIKYGFWGCVSTGINLIIFYAFLFCRMQYIVANVISYIIAVGFSFWFNNKFVFKENNDNNLKKGIKFFLMRGISIIVDSGLLIILCEKLGINVFVSKILDSAIIIVCTFVISKLFIFQQNKHI